MDEQTEQPLPATRRLKELLPDAVVETTIYHGQTSVVVRLESLLDVCRALKNDERLQFDYLIDVTAVDWLYREPRFDVVYHLYSVPLGHMLRLKTRVADGQEVDSVESIWKLADWGERETYDMYGIVFRGHPDLRRILLPEDWTDGFPLRKDYPLGGYGIWAAEHVPFR